MCVLLRLPASPVRLRFPSFDGVAQVVEQEDLHGTTVAPGLFIVGAFVNGRGAVHATTVGPLRSVAEHPSRLGVPSGVWLDFYNARPGIPTVTQTYA